MTVIGICMSAHIVAYLECQHRPMWVQKEGKKEDKPAPKEDTKPEAKEEKPQPPPKEEKPAPKQESKPPPKADPKKEPSKVCFYHKVSTTNDICMVTSL